jgi:hypothetical protein
LDFEVESPGTVAEWVITDVVEPEVGVGVGLFDFCEKDSGEAD